MRKTLLLAAVIASLALVSCNRVPSYVVKPDKMAKVMADMRMADAVIVVSPDEFTTLPEKIRLRQAVLDANGITAEQFDTSLVWYGHNIDKYQGVTEKSIDILENRMKEINVIASGEAAMSVAGDSVDLWEGPQTISITSKSPSQFVTFAMDKDANWQKGDIYTLRAHPVVPPQSVSWAITMAYADGTVETTGGSVAPNSTTRQELAFHSDSTREAIRISGWISIVPDRHKPAVLDSLSLTRRRMVPEKYLTNRYQQRSIVPKELKEREDSVAKAARQSTDNLNTTPAERNRYEGRTSFSKISDN